MWKRRDVTCKGRGTQREWKGHPTFANRAPPLTVAVGAYMSAVKMVVEYLKSDRLARAVAA